MSHDADGLLHKRAFRAVERGKYSTSRFEAPDHVFMLLLCVEEDVGSEGDWRG